MKKQTVSLPVLLLAASGFFFSCGNTMNKNAGALEFDSIQAVSYTHLFAELPQRLVLRQVFQAALGNEPAGIQKQLCLLYTSINDMDQTGMHNVSGHTNINFLIHKFYIS